MLIRETKTIEVVKGVVRDDFFSSPSVVKVRIPLDILEALSKDKNVDILDVKISSLVTKYKTYISSSKGMPYQVESWNRYSDKVLSVKLDYTPFCPAALYKFSVSFLVYYGDTQEYQLLNAFKIEND